MRLIPPYKRIKKEYDNLKKNPIQERDVVALEKNYKTLLVTITGPPNSLYEDGIFALHVDFPYYYPFRPLKLHFITKIFHPQVMLHGEFHSR